MNIKKNIEQFPFTQTDCPPPAIKLASNLYFGVNFLLPSNGVDQFPNYEFLWLFMSSQITAPSLFFPNETTHFSDAIDCWQKNWNSQILNRNELEAACKCCSYYGTSGVDPKKRQLHGGTYGSLKYYCWVVWLFTVCKGMSKRLNMFNDYCAKHSSFMIITI